jgi:acyl carrier protein
MQGACSLARHSWKSAPPRSETLSDESTRTVVERAIREELDDPNQNLDAVHSLEEAGIDSLAVIEIMFKLEEHFKIKFPEGKLPLSTVQDIVDLVDRLLREQHGDTK